MAKNEQSNLIASIKMQHGCQQEIYYKLSNRGGGAIQY